MTRGKKLQDPVDGKIEETAAVTEAQEMEESFDMANLSMADLSRIPQKVTMATDPFEGYPFKKITVNKEIGKIPAAWIVVLDPNVHVHQDPSNLGLTVRDAETGKERRQDLKTYHNRCASDSRGQNLNMVFDREMQLSDGQKAQYAIIPDNAARSQVCFVIDSKAKVHTDTRYWLLDSEQASRLRKVFNNVHYQQLKGERAANKHETDK